MNGMVHFESQIRYNVIFSSDHVLFLPFNPRFCVMQSQNMQKRSTQTLYQYLGTKVANPVNYDTGDDTPCRVQQRVHLHPGAYRVITALPLV